MPARLFDKLVGTFRNGIPVQHVPPHLQTVFSVQDHLHRIVNEHAHNDQLSQAKGFPDIYDTYAKVPDNIKPFETIIKDIILQNEPLIKDVVVTDWHIVKKGASLACVLLCATKKEKEVYRFRLKLRGAGGHEVELWD